ncbi:MAG TPA: hypothetical protein VJV05_01030 [Pyrinomonadaceae bacterium]|nr:hypothetical protein [Pyrinomonadaceae bacterium]
MRKVVVVFAFPAIVLFFSVVTHAQLRSTPLRKHETLAPKNTAVVTQLDRQRIFLQKVTSRYEAVSINEFTPYFSYAYVWKALRENRDQLAREARHLTAVQFAAVKNGYDLLERDVLFQFVDQQSGVFSSELDLNEVQTVEVEKLLLIDLKKKRSLLSAQGLNEVSFAQRVMELSDATERQILAILFPEQRERFRRQVSFSRNRLVG